jgi:hypothetical protein
MPQKPVIFVSAVSRELSSARQVVVNTLTFLGYEPDWKDIFGSEKGDLRGMLRRRIDASAGVVQIIGQRYGAEPPTPDEHFGRCSYTQYEALYARQRGKEPWLLFLDETFPADPVDPEPDELRNLQQAYRERLSIGTELYQPIKTADELKIAALQLRQELAELRRGHRRWAAAALALLLLLAGGFGWIKYEQHLGARKTDQHGQQLTEIQAQNEAQKERDSQLLAALRELPQTLGQTTQVGQKEDEATRLARAYAVLEEKLQLPAGTLEKELPRFAEQLLSRSDTSALDRANALFATKKFAEAEAAALEAKDQALAAAGQPIRDAIRALRVAGNAAFRQIHYVRALGHFSAAAALTDRQRDPLEWASVQWNIASVLHTRSQYREAEEVYTGALEAYQRARGSEDISVLRLRNDLAYALRDQGKPAVAEAEHRAVLDIQKRVLGAEHLDTLASRINLAAALADQRKYAEAEEEYQVMLSIFERARRAEHRYTLAIRANLATILHAQDKSVEAEAEHRAVLAIRVRMHGLEHPDTLLDRYNLAAVLAGQGRCTEAGREFRTVLDIQKRVLGKEHRQTLKCWNNLAAALAEQGKYAEAEQENRAVLAIRERVQGAEDPDVFLSCHNLALALEGQKKYQEALYFVGRAVVGLSGVLGAQHSNTKNAVVARERIEGHMKGDLSNQ